MHNAPATAAGDHPVGFFLLVVSLAITATITSQFDELHLLCAASNVTCVKVEDPDILYAAAYRETRTAAVYNANCHTR